VKNTATTLKRQLEGVHDQLEQVHNVGPDKWMLMTLFKIACGTHGVSFFHTEHSEVVAMAALFPHLQLSWKG
jgi:hypothetical protein